MREFSRRDLITVALVMGFSSGIIQVLLIREILTLCRGNELIIGIIYASWFLGIYSGARYKPAQTGERLVRRLCLSVFMLPVSALVSIYCIYFIQVVFSRPAGGFYSFTTELFMAFIFTLPVSFSAGLFFPSLVSLTARHDRERSGGTVFCADSIGFFAGGIIFAFILVDHVNPAGIISMLLLTAAVTIPAKNKAVAAALAVIPILMLVFSGRMEKRIIEYTWNRTHAGKLESYSRTRFQAVAVESSGDSVSIYGDGIFMYSLPDRYESRGVFHLVQSLGRGRVRVLLLGSGPGSLLHNLLESDIESLSYFEPDPSLWRILLPYVNTYYSGTLSNKLTVSGDELKHFLKQGSEKFDMIISIPPGPENIMLNRFYTREFYSLCREHLDEEGILIAAIHGFSDYMSEERRDYIASIYSAFCMEFPVHIATSGETIYLAGAKREGILPTGTDRLVSDYGRQICAGSHLFEKEVTENYSPDELKMMFEKSQTDYFYSVMNKAAGMVEPNSDIRPGAYWRNILLSAFREKSAVYRIIKSFLFIPVIIILVSFIALADIRRRHGTSHMVNGLLICLTGFISISTMLVMVIICQNSSGIVYHRISLINALYMLGLGLGSFYFNKKQALKPPCIFAGIGLTLIPVYSLTVFESDLLFWPVIPVFSFLCGALFPVLFKSLKGESYASASVLDSMDNFGAIAGSLLTVLFLVPLAGIQFTIMLNAMLVITALLISIRVRVKG